MDRLDAIRRPVIGSVLGVVSLVAANAAQADCLGYAYWRPQYATVTRNVVVAPARQLVRRIGPIVRDVTERVLVQPERRLSRVVPAVTRTLTERVLVKPASTVTRYIPPIQDVARSRQPGAKGGLVELRAAQSVVDTTPASYATRSRTVVVQAARTRVQIVPAVYAVRTRRIEVTPARVVITTQPAQVRAVARTIMVRPGVGPLLAQGPQFCPQLVGAAPIVWYFPAQW